LFCAEKLLMEEAIVLSLSDTSGTIYFKNGLTPQALQKVMQIKNNLRISFQDFFQKDTLLGAEFHLAAIHWAIVPQYDLTFPCATQNEINGYVVKCMVAAQCFGVIEVSNMSSTPEAIAMMKQHNILLAPSKAAN